MTSYALAYRDDTTGPTLTGHYLTREAAEQARDAHPDHAWLETVEVTP